MPSCSNFIEQALRCSEASAFVELNNYPNLSLIRAESLRDFYILTYWAGGRRWNKIMTGESDILGTLSLLGSECNMCLPCVRRNVPQMMLAHCHITAWWWNRMFSRTSCANQSSTSISDTYYTWLTTESYDNMADQTCYNPNKPFRNNRKLIIRL